MDEQELTRRVLQMEKVEDLRKQAAAQLEGVQREHTVELEAQRAAGASEHEAAMTAVHSSWSEKHEALKAEH